MSNRRRHALHALAAAVALALPLQSLAAFDAFLKVDGIDGESAAEGHKGEIVLESWSFGATNAVSAGTAGRTASKACLSEISLVKVVDKATPLLLGAARVGATIPKAVMAVRKKGEKQQEFLIVTMSDVPVTSVREGHGGGDVLLEAISLSVGSMQLSYKPLAADGSLLPGCRPR